MSANDKALALLKAVVCVYCGATVMAAGVEVTPEVAEQMGETMREHDLTCADNPLVQSSAALKADRDALLAALVRIENATRYDSTRDEGMVAHCIGDYLDWDEVAEALAALPAHLQKEVAE